MGAFVRRAAQVLAFIKPSVQNSQTRSSPRRRNRLTLRRASLARPVMQAENDGGLQQNRGGLAPLLPVCPEWCDTAHQTVNRQINKVCRTMIHTFAAKMRDVTRPCEADVILSGAA